MIDVARKHQKLICKERSTLNMLRLLKKSKEKTE